MAAGNTQSSERCSGVVLDPLSFVWATQVDKVPRIKVQLNAKLLQKAHLLTPLAYAFPLSTMAW
jgi:hypothetical protein